MAPDLTSPITDHRPKISILLITYNHEKYIAQALESILMQETEYDYEINVIEDCSTDQTQEIVMRYVEEYPDKVKPYFNKRNIGYKVTQKNFYRGFKTLKGDYIAILEGDDYWTSPHKLQKQVSFLEANPDYVACAHNAIKVYEDSSSEPHRFLYWPGLPDTHTIENLILLSSYFHTTTLTYRNVFRGNPPPQFEDPWSCEIFVTIAHAQFGKIRYFDEDMSVYRAHGGGRFSNMKLLDAWLFNINGLRRYNQWLRYRYLKTFSSSIVRYCNVVLHDKGREATALSAFQFAKYLGIRTLYEIIGIITHIPEKLPPAPRAAITRDLPFREELLARARFIWSWIFYPSKLVMSTLLQFLMAIVAATYDIIADLLPDTAKDSIRNFEKSHRGLSALRMLIRQSRFFSRRSLKVAYFTVLSNLGLKPKQRNRKKSFAKLPQAALH